MQVLIVDDDKHYSFAVKSMLEDAGFLVTVAHSGNEALKALADGLKAGMVFLDLVLPDMPGQEVLKKIRERFPWIPVAMVSGYDIGTMPTGEIKPATRVDKPVTKADLIDILEKYGLPDPKS